MRGSSIPAAVIVLWGLMLVGCGGGGGGGDSVVVVGGGGGTEPVTSLGSEFMLSLPSPLLDVYIASDFTATLRITSPTNTAGTVTFNGTDTPFTVTAGTTTEVLLDSAAYITTNDTVEAKGVLVVSNDPVSVQVVSYKGGSTDGYLALPTNVLGTEYRVMSHGSAIVSTAFSEFVVVASQDATTVTVTPFVSAGVHAAGTPYTVSLNAGETYQLQGDALLDLTGTQVSADQPVALFSGHSCGNVPSNVGYCDYLVEQLPPVGSWGYDFVTVPHAARTGGDVVRVLAAYDGTSVSTDGAAPVTLNAGEYLDQTLTAVAEISADQPVAVAQFMQGGAIDSAGDPSMMLVLPKWQYLTDTSFDVYALPSPLWMGVSIVTETAHLDTLTIDGVTVNPVDFTTVGDGLYSTAQLPLAAGSHSITGSGGSSVSVYGTSNNPLESYSYPAGMAF